MRLRPKHIAKLTPAERRAYAPLIGHVDYESELRTRFIAQSHKYVEGDEHALPFPERSKPGVMLFSLCQHLARSRAALVFDPSVPQNILHVKRKLLAMGAEKVYAVPSEQLLACIHAEGANPFQYWRDAKPLELPDLPVQGPSVLCALEPPFSTIKDTSEWTVRGALLDPPDDVDTLERAPYYREIARIGMTDVTVLNVKAWITRERAEPSQPRPHPPTPAEQPPPEQPPPPPEQPQPPPEQPPPPPEQPASEQPQGEPSRHED